MAQSVSRGQVLYGPKDLRMIERPLAPPSNGEVQIAIKSTTLCGSDLHYFNHYANGDIKVRQPLTQGHESAGLVVAVGANVSNLKEGDRVAIEAGVPCETCVHCLSGRYNGTLQDRINHPARWCHKLPDDFSYDEGALLEPLSVAIQAARKATIEPETRCLVIGAGAVGLLCSTVARRKGCRNIVMTDIAAPRLEFARENGFATACLVTQARPKGELAEDLSHAKHLAQQLLEVGDDAVQGKGGFDVVFECTGVESCVRLAIYATSPGGTVLLVGMGTPMQTLHLSAATFREVDLRGVWRYADTYPEALDVMRTMKREPDAPVLTSIITHTFCGLESVPQAFAVAGKATDEHGKLVVKVVVQA